jgi:hypothetical protein
MWGPKSQTFKGAEAAVPDALNVLNTLRRLRHLIYVLILIE